MIDLKNKKTLITGGSRGIGSAAAILFAKAGSDISITYNTDQVSAENVRKEIETIGRKCLVFKADLSKKQDADNCVTSTLNEFGIIDILVNNHGIWNDGPIDTMSEETWDEMININLKSYYLMCNAVVPGMKKNNAGRIINLTSTAGQRGEAFHSHYAASKGGIISFTKSLSSELAPKRILVNGVAPGWVDTDMNNEIFSDPEEKKKIIDGIPLKRIPTGLDIAGSILFLASDLANHISGEIINVNGGAVLCG